MGGEQQDRIAVLGRPRPTCFTGQCTVHSAQCTSLIGQIPTCHTTSRCTASCYAKQFNHPERVEIANNEALQLIVLFSVASQFTAFICNQANPHCVQNERLEPRNCL